MADPNLSNDEQDQIVQELDEGIHNETLEVDEEPWNELYNQLDQEHKWEVDDNLQAYADNAVGGDWNQG